MVRARYGKILMSIAIIVVRRLDVRNLGDGDARATNEIGRENVATYEIWRENVERPKRTRFSSMRPGCDVQ